MKPTWTPIRIKLGQLQPWSENPRTSTKAQAKRILASFEQFGQVVPVVIGPSAEVYDGHQRLSALLTVHGPDYEVEARQSDRALTDEERRALVLALANATGSWSWDQLSGWNVDTLKEWGFDSDTLHGWNMDALNLREMLNSDAELVDPNEEWEGMPEFEHKDFEVFKSITVHFDTPEDMENFAKLTEQTITEKTKSIWYPKKEKRELKDLAYRES